MKRSVILLLLMALLGQCLLQAQDTIDLRDGEVYHLGGPKRHSVAVADTLPRWDFHVSLGSGVTVGNRGTVSAFGVTPSVVWRPSERLKVTASGTLMDSYALMPRGFHLRGQEPRNVAPLRHPQGGSVAGALRVEAEYQVNERLWVAGSLTRLTGRLASGALVSPWLYGRGPVDLDATALSADLRYRFKNNTFLDVHMTVIDDRTGAMGPLIMGGPYGYGYGYGYSPLFVMP